MPTLYEITGALREATDGFLAALEEAGGDADHPIVQAALKGLSCCQAALADKAEAYAVIVTECNARADYREAESRRLATRARGDRNAADTLKARLQGEMEFLNQTKLQTPHFRVAVVGNGGKRPLVIDDPAAIPAALMRTIPERTEPDSDRIRAFLEDGAEVAGAHLNERGRHLSIR
jgi:hypothetical protein